MYAQNALPSTNRHVSQAGRHLPPQQPSLMDLDTPQFVAAIAESAAIFVHPANVSLLYPASGDARLQQRDSAPIPMYEAQPDFIPTPGALHYDLRGGIAVPHLKVTPGAVHPYIKRLAQAGPASPHGVLPGINRLSDRVGGFSGIATPAHGRVTSGSQQSPSPEVRLCATSGCDSVLPPEHLWIVFNKCLLVTSDPEAGLTVDSRPAMQLVSVAGQVVHPEVTQPQRPVSESASFENLVVYAAEADSETSCQQDLQVKTSVGQSHSPTNGAPAAQIVAEMVERACQALVFEYLR